MVSTSCTPRTARRQSTARGFLPTSPLRGTTHRTAVPHLPHHISIHVPLAGDDQRAGHNARQTVRISIHVPLAGDDLCALTGKRLEVCKFLSTSPLRGTTSCASWGLIPPEFLSTSPLRGTTKARQVQGQLLDISIHVPLAGDDNNKQPQKSRKRHFYPRPPCGGRRRVCTRGILRRYFYPRPPCGGRLAAPR